MVIENRLKKKVTDQFSGSLHSDTSSRKIGLASIAVVALSMFLSGCGAVVVQRSLWWIRLGVLLQASVVKPRPFRQSPTWKALKSNLENPATTIIKTNKKNAARLVSTSRKENLSLANPACMPGVLIVVPNFKALCGRRKL